MSAESTISSSLPPIVSSNTLEDSLENRLEKALKKEAYAEINALILSTKDFSNTQTWVHLFKQLLRAYFKSSNTECIWSCIKNLIQKSPGLSSIENEDLLWIVSVSLSKQDDTFQFLENFFSKYTVNFEVGHHVKNQLSSPSQVGNPLFYLLYFPSSDEWEKLFKLLFTQGAFTQENRTSWGTLSDLDNPLTVYDVLSMRNELDLMHWIALHIQDTPTILEGLMTGYSVFEAKTLSFLNNRDWQALYQILCLRGAFNQEKMGYASMDIENLYFSLFCSLLPNSQNSPSLVELNWQHLCLNLILPYISQDKLASLSSANITDLLHYLLLKKDYDLMYACLTNNSIKCASSVYAYIESMIMLDTQPQNPTLKAQILEHVRRYIPYNVAFKVMSQLIEKRNYQGLRKYILSAADQQIFKRASELIYELHRLYNETTDCETQKEIAICMRLLLKKGVTHLTTSEKDAAVLAICLKYAPLKAMPQLLELVPQITLSPEELAPVYRALLPIFSKESPSPKFPKGCKHNVTHCYKLLWSKGQKETVYTILTDQEQPAKKGCPYLYGVIIDYLVEQNCHYEMLASLLQSRNMLARKRCDSSMSAIYENYKHASLQEQSLQRTCLLHLYLKGGRCSEAKNLLAAIMIETYQPDQFDQLTAFLKKNKPNLSYDMGNQEYSYMPLSLAVRLPIDESEKLKLICLLHEAGATDGRELKTGQTALEIAHELGITTNELLDKLGPPKNKVFTISKCKFWLKQPNLTELHEILKNTYRKEEAREFEIKNQSNGVGLFTIAIHHILLSHDDSLANLLVKKNIAPPLEVIQEIFKGKVEEYCRFEIDYHKTSEDVLAFHLILNFLVRANANPGTLPSLLQARLIWFALCFLHNELRGDWIKGFLDVLMHLCTVNPYEPVVIKGTKTTLAQELIKKYSTENQLMARITSYLAKYPKPVPTETRVTLSSEQLQKKRNGPSLPPPTVKPQTSFADFLKDQKLERILEIKNLGNDQIQFHFVDQEACNYASTYFGQKSFEKMYEIFDPKDAPPSFRLRVLKTLAERQMQNFIRHWAQFSVKAPVNTEFVISGFIPTETATVKKSGSRTSTTSKKDAKTNEVDEARIARQKLKQLKKEAKEQRKLEKRAKSKGKEKTVNKEKEKENENDPSFKPPAVSSPSSSPPQSSTTQSQIELFPFGVIQEQKREGIEKTEESKTIGQNAPMTLEEVVPYRLNKARKCLISYEDLRAHPEYIEDRSLWLIGLSQYLMQACEAICPTGQVDTHADLIKEAMRPYGISASTIKHIRNTLRFNIKLTDDDLEKLFSLFDNMQLKSSIDSYWEKLPKKITASSRKRFVKYIHLQSKGKNEFSINFLFTYIKLQSEQLKLTKHKLNAKELISQMQFNKHAGHYHAVMRKILSNIQKAVEEIEENIPKENRISNDTIDWVKKMGRANAHCPPELLPQGGELIIVPSTDLFEKIMRVDTAYLELDLWIELAEGLLSTPSIN